MTIIDIAKFDSGLGFRHPSGLKHIHTYRTACLLEKDGIYVTLLSEERSGLPGSLNIRGNNIKHTAKILTSGMPAAFSFKNAACWDSSLASDFRVPGKQAVKNVKRIIRKRTDSNTPGSLIYPEGETLAAILGAGPGLTPAGDDFITGALNLSYSMSRQLFMKIKKDIENLLNSTSRLSRHYISAALEGRAGEDMKSLISGLRNNNCSKMERSADAIASYGNTSGRSMLEGFLWALKRI